MRRQQGGEKHQPQADAVHADVVMDGRRGDPRYIRLEDEFAGTAEPERRDEAERGGENEERDDQGEVLDHARLFFGKRENQQEPGQRQQDDEIEQRHRMPPANPMASKTTTEPSTTQAA